MDKNYKPLVISKKLTKDKLIRVINGKSMMIKKLQNTGDIRKSQIRLFRIKLLRIRREIDYLLQHPWSVNNTHRKLK
jgi:hypothetical protein